MKNQLRSSRRVPASDMSLPKLLRLLLVDLLRLPEILPDEHGHLG